MTTIKNQTIATLLAPCLLLGLSTACSGDSSAVDASPVADGSSTDRSTNDSFAPLTKQLEDSFAASPADVGGMTLIIFDEFDQRLYEHTVGDFSADRDIPIASSSKLVSGLVILRLIEEGLLSFENTTGEILGWQVDNAAITLDQLGGFVSGLVLFDGCTIDPNTSLEQCVAQIEGTALADAPGATFNYSNSHLHVAGRMAEVATSSGWQQVVDDYLFEPLGIKSANLLFYTFPKMSRGTTNPLIAGGLRASANQYAEVLALLFHKGKRSGDQLIAESLIERMSENRFTGAALGSSPYSGTGYDYRYSFASWLECEGPVVNCDVVSSAGSFGFVPWVDYNQRYYAILAMEGDRGTSTYAVQVQHDLQPLITEALAPSR